jgi:hypothetical protein
LNDGESVSFQNFAKTSFHIASPLTFGWSRSIVIHEEKTAQMQLKTAKINVLIFCEKDVGAIWHLTDMLPFSVPKMDHKTNGHLTSAHQKIRIWEIDDIVSKCGKFMDFNQLRSLVTFIFLKTRPLKAIDSIYYVNRWWLAWV